MVHDQPGGRTPSHSPEAVLAEARRMAADIRRQAERDASRIRREAAEWAADTRRAAEQHRDLVLAQLAHATDHATDRAEATPSAPTTPASSPAGPEGEVIDLRSRAESREADAVIETSIDTKLHDVVRHAVRRTFPLDEQGAITGR